jgi:hypothetical protein
VRRPDQRSGLLDQGLGVLPVLAADGQDGPLGQGDEAATVAPVSWATSTASASTPSARARSPASRWEIPTSSCAGPRQKLPTASSVRASSASAHICPIPWRHSLARSSARQPSIELPSGSVPW